MGKRTIYECDFLKREYDPDETVTLTIKYKNKSGRKYEISIEAAQILEGQLTSGRQLPVGWDFPSVLPPSSGSLPPDSAPSRREEDEDAQLVRRIKEDHADRLNNQQDVNAEGIIFEQENCTHMNRTRMHVTETEAYSHCKDCGMKIPAHKKEDREAMASLKPPTGSREGYFEGK